MCTTALTNYIFPGTEHCLVIAKIAYNSTGYALEKLDVPSQYVGKTTGVFKKFLQFFLYTRSVGFNLWSKTLSPIITGIGFSSALSIPLNIRNLKNEIFDAHAHYKNSDEAGFSLSMIDTAVLVCDTALSYLALENAMRLVTSHAPYFTLLHKLTMTGVYAIFVGSLIKNLYSTYKLVQMKSECLKAPTKLKSKYFTSDKSKAGLKRVVGNTMFEQIKLCRSKDNKIVKENLQNIVQRKLAIKTVHIAASFFTLSGLILLGSSFAATPVAYLITASLIHFSTFIYERWFLESDIRKLEIKTA